MAQLVKNSSAMCETGFDSWVGKIPCSRKGYPLQYSGLKNSMYSLWGPKGLDMTERHSLAYNLEVESSAHMPIGEDLQSPNLTSRKAGKCSQLPRNKRKLFWESANRFCHRVDWWILKSETQSKDLS